MQVHYYVQKALSFVIFHSQMTSINSNTSSKLIAFKPLGKRETTYNAMRKDMSESYIQP